MESWGDVCGKCGARRVDAQLGLEATPALYVAHMVEVFREVRRVLRSDGTVWLNLGDSFASGKGTCFNPGGGENSLGQERKAAGAHPLDRGSVVTLRQSGLKPKDLVGIPWRVAFALQEDGWWLRSDIIWHKPNPMPESVTDRPTKSHEYLFLLAKSAQYFYDAEAVKEPYAEGAEAKLLSSRPSQMRYTLAGEGIILGRKEKPNCGLYKQTINPNGRNHRSVWTISTRPYGGAHFAVMPEALVEPCILAGTSERGACPKCGKPWERVVETTRTFESGSGKAGHLPVGKNGAGLQGGGETLDVRRGPCVHATTTGWRPGCACDAGEPVPCVVLDPFAGAGTVGVVAKRLGRDAVLIDLNPTYINDLAAKRINETQPALEGM